MTATLCPCNAHGKRVGRTTLLPILLGGVLPCAGDEALTEYLMLLLEEGGGGGGGPPWGLRHRGELLPVLQFVGAIEDMQLEMLKVMHLLVASPAELSRQAAALLATALACRLGEEAVERRLLPALARLTEDKNRKVLSTAPPPPPQLLRLPPLYLLLRDAKVASVVEDEPEDACLSRGQLHTVPVNRIKYAEWVHGNAIKDEYPWSVILTGVPTHTKHIVTTRCDDGE